MVVIKVSVCIWLERGVKKRGGEAPSQQTLPLSNGDITGV
jgi:hypothetical protein